jgi:hypothetical protein
MEKKARIWEDYVPDYASLLSFVDIFYSATLGVGLVLVGLIFDHHFDQGGLDWAPLILLAFSILYLIGDYVDSRLFTARYSYKGLSRFFIDLSIGLVFFASFITAYHSSPVFFLAMAAAFLLGALWCICLQFGVADAKPLRFPTTVTGGHLFAGVFFIWLWKQHRFQHKLFVPDTLKAVLWYGGWAICYVAAEVVLNIPPKEADLLPNFPVGRIVRRLQFIHTARQRLMKKCIPIIGGVLDWVNKEWSEFSKNNSAETSDKEDKTHHARGGAN